MNHTYFLGIDIGTTSTKAILAAWNADAPSEHRSAALQIKGMGNQGYPLQVPQPGWAEQDPDAILKAVVVAVQEAIAPSGIAGTAIAAIGFSAAMHSLIAVDQQGKPLTPSIVWADNRSMAQTDRLRQDGSGHALYLRTGTPIHPMSPLTKLLWLREETPDIFQQAAKFISIKEYILWRWLDRFVVDDSIASTTGLFNLQHRQWDQEALARVGIQSDRLSELVPTTHILRGLKSEYATAMDLDTQVAIVIGANDGVLANLGVGAIAPQQVAITIGTSSAVRTVVSQPRTDDQGRTFCYALTADRWVIGGASNSGGGILRWWRDGFSSPLVESAQPAGKNSYDLLIEAAAQVAAGAEGLICLPFLSGERAPYWNPRARGIFFGVGLHHDRSHFTRAILEGILFAVRSINLALQDLAGTPQEIRAGGGFARSPVWRQMLADVLGFEVIVPEVYEASGLGAIALTMYAVGAIDRLEDVRNLIRVGDRHQPNPQLTDTYRQLFEIYDRLYQNNVETFTQLSNQVNN